MKKSEFFYELPPELIAQHPIEPRDSSRLLKLDRQTGKIEHGVFRDLLHDIHPGDCLVLNNTRVIPARIYGVKQGTGALVEFLLLNQKELGVWEALAGPGKKAREGSVFNFGEGMMQGEVLEVLENGNRLVKFTYDGNFFEVLDKIGQMPLPHYITEELKDKERYQTVYSKELGSAAAPTAGLHFTEEMLDELRENGVEVVFLTLHVGIGTFRPVKVEEITDHKMHSEHYYLSAQAARTINDTKKNGGRVIAVGTTCCRTLESIAQKYGHVEEDDDWTDIFIYPGYTFRCIDGLITNFHLPESTLIMLVSAFAGYEHTMHAYHVAVEERYRFYSLGDAMYIE